MKQFSRILLSLTLTGFFLSSCKRLDNLEYSPKQTPDSFLASQHWVKVQLADFSLIWSQPSSTFIVYFVGLFSMYAGYRFLSRSQGMQSMRLWGIGLMLTGLGALFAGTSYQAFGYELKCEGRQFCTYTTWFEVIYLLFSVPGMSAFLVAGTYTSLKDKFRKVIIAYAAINTSVYFFLLLYGAFKPVFFYVTFEFLVVVSAPSVLFLTFLHGIAYMKYRDRLNSILLNSWLIFISVGITYGIYLSCGFTQILWRRGVWFTENDVLHVGIIYWVYYVYRNIPIALKNSTSRPISILR